MDLAPTGPAFYENTGAKWFVTEPGKAFTYLYIKPHAWHGNLICMKSVGWVITIYVKQTPHQPQDRWGILLLFFHVFRRKLQESPATVTSRLWEWPVGVWAKAWGREETRFWKALTRKIKGCRQHCLGSRPASSQKLSSLVSLCLGMNKTARLPDPPEKGDRAGLQDLSLTEAWTDNQNTGT